MKYITKTELLTLVKENILNDLTQENNNILDELELLAMSEVDAIIGSKYNMTEVFNRKGENRNPFIKNLVINVMLYYLHMRLTPNQIPVIRETLYKEAIGYLMQVAKGVISPPISRNELPFNPRSSESLYGCGTKVNDSIY
jgi:phage gp36-like protein